MSKKNLIKRKLTGLKSFYLIVILVAIFGIYGVYKNIVINVSGINENTPSSELIASEIQTDTGLTKYELKFRTGTERENNAISVFTFRLKLPFENQVLNESGEVVESIEPDSFIEGSDKWTIAINKVYSQGEDRYVDFSVINLDKEGYKSSEHQLFASFYLKKSDNADIPLQIEILKEFSHAFTKNRPVTNIWDSPQFLKIE